MCLLELNPDKVLYLYFFPTKNYQIVRSRHNSLSQINSDRHLTHIFLFFSILFHFISFIYFSTPFLCLLRFLFFFFILARLSVQHLRHVSRVWSRIWGDRRVPADRILPREQRGRSSLRKPSVSSHGTNAWEAKGWPCRNGGWFQENKSYHLHQLGLKH